MPKIALVILIKRLRLYNKRTNITGIGHTILKVSTGGKKGGKKDKKRENKMENKQEN